MSRITSKAKAQGPKSKASRKAANQANRDMFSLAYEAQLKAGAVKKKVPRNGKQAKTILIAENNPDQAMVTKVILEHEGYDCTIAENGSQAVRLASTVMPDLIITGIQLAVVDGLKVAELIRNEPKTRAIPILIVSAKNPYEDWLSTPRPCDDYLRKPFTSFRLISSVERLIK